MRHQPLGDEGASAGLDVDQVLVADVIDRNNRLVDPAAIYGCIRHRAVFPKPASLGEQTRRPDAPEQPAHLSLPPDTHVADPTVTAFTRFPHASGTSTRLESINSTA